MPRSGDDNRTVKLQVLLFCLAVAVIVFLSSIGLGVLYVRANEAQKLTGEQQQPLIR